MLCRQCRNSVSITPAVAARHKEFVFFLVKFVVQVFYKRFLCFNFLVYFFLFLVTLGLFTGLPCLAISSRRSAAFAALSLSTAWRTRLSDFRFTRIRPFSPRRAPRTCMGPHPIRHIPCQGRSPWLSGLDQPTPFFLKGSARFPPF